MFQRLLARFRPPAWKAHPSAPESDTLVCALADLEEQVPRYLTIGSGVPPFFCFVFRRGDTVKAFLAQCPHRDRPLGIAGQSPLYSRGSIACNHHGALFSVDSGLCTQGPCKGQRLIPVPVHVRDAQVRIGS